MWIPCASSPRRSSFWLVVIAGIVLYGFAAAIAALAEAVDSEPLLPVPPVEALDPGKIELGRKMFHDPRLSRGERVSCASCHDLDRGGDDGRARSAASDGRPLDFNAATVFNAALNARLNWRGNFRTLEEQNEAVLLDPRLMNTTWPELLATLGADSDYHAAFEARYGAAPAREHVLDALATFQRSLITPDARFDRYLRGERGAIDADEARGYQLFKAYGCAACHQGVNIGGNLFQKFGIFHDPFAERGGARPPDVGRYSITGREDDRYVFRVPSLRNVAVTAPYFHDGRARTLADAVDTMAKVQLGMTLTPEEIDVLVQFLQTLTGEYRGRPVAMPAPTAR
jgi:cytochrome c peroxidase